MIEEVPIGDLVLDRETWDPAADGAGEFHYIDLSSIDKGEKRISGIERIACRDAPSRARQLVSAGDVLVATVRPNLNGVALVGEEHEGMTASTGYTVLRANPERIDSHYLFHWVRTPMFVDRMVAVATGASYPAVSDTKVKTSGIPLPPLHEQKRIAAILDAADALRTKRRESLAQLDMFVQALFLDMFGDPVMNPKGWDTGPIERWFDVARGGSPRPISEYITEEPNGINWIMIGDADPDSRYIRSTEKKIRPEGVRKSREVSDGDFLLTNSMSFGRPYILRTSGCIHDGWLVLSPKSEAVHSEYFFNILSTDALHREFARRASGAVVKNLNTALVRSVPIPVPPIGRQREFAELVTAIEGQRKRLTSHLAELDILFASLQSRAFRGEL